LEKHTVSIFRTEDGDSMFLQNVGICLQIHTVLQPRRPAPMSSLPWELQNPTLHDFGRISRNHHCGRPNKWEIYSARIALSITYECPAKYKTSLHISCTAWINSFPVLVHCLLATKKKCVNFLQEMWYWFFCCFITSLSLNWTFNHIRYWGGKVCCSERYGNKLHTWDLRLS
jgi:hypothetical protein